MLVKSSIILLAVTGLVSAGKATCKFQSTFFGTLTSLNDAPTDWNFFVGRSLADELASGIPVQVGASTLEPGPEGVENNFFITNTVGADALTDFGVAALIGTWPGRSFTGRSTGVVWSVDNVSCG